MVKFKCFASEIPTPALYRGPEYELYDYFWLDEIGTDAITYEPSITIPNMNHNVVFDVDGIVGSSKFYVLVKVIVAPLINGDMARIPEKIIGVSPDREWLLDLFVMEEFAKIKLGIVAEFRYLAVPFQHPLMEKELVNAGYTAPVTPENYRTQLSENNFLTIEWRAPDGIYYLAKVKSV